MSRENCEAISTARVAKFDAYWAGDPAGFKPNLPFTWGTQPHKGLIYFNDIDSGLWIVKLGARNQKDSTTAPGH